MSIKLKGSTGGSVSWDAPADTSPAGTDVTLTLPTSAGSAGQVLKNSSTAGTLEFGDLSQGLVLTRATAITTTSGTSIDFTNIPANVYRITVMFDGVSLSGTDDILIRIGDSGGIETTGYASGAAGSTSTTWTTSTAGFILQYNYNSADTYALQGSTVITNLTGNTWVSQGTNYVSGYQVGGHNAGSKTLSGTLDRLSIVSETTNTFDAGKVNIIYEVQS